jgi:uncharacterized damage-inducible protein DinB
MADDTAVRELLARLLAWGDAHVTFDAAVEEIPVKLRGKRPARLPHSIWQLVEHLRIAQYDILDFCINPHYKEMKWPDDYWPASAAPRSPSAWTKSLRQFRRDRRALQALAADTSIDLEAKIPHGSGQTYMRELLLAADHGAYHVGQIVLIRRLLGVWSGA